MHFCKVFYLYLMTAHASALILQHVRQSIDMDPGEAKYFLSLLRKNDYSKKQIVVRSGEICRNQLFVTKGSFKVYYNDAEGNEHVAKFAMENWWAFDIESFFHQVPAFYSIAAMEQSQTLELSFEAYNALLCRVPAFERFYRMLLQNSFISLQHRMTQSLSLTAPERYARFQEKYPGLEARIAQKDIASYLGITPVFLSMLRKLELEKH